jgi:hypothetical protein
MPGAEGFPEAELRGVYRSAIGTALSLIELGDYCTLRNSWKENTLCYRMWLLKNSFARNSQE